jgi:hypothetical protein
MGIVFFTRHLYCVQDANIFLHHTSGCRYFLIYTWPRFQESQIAPKVAILTLEGVDRGSQTPSRIDQLLPSWNVAQRMTKRTKFVSLRRLGSDAVDLTKSTSAPIWRWLIASNVDISQCSVDNRCCRGVCEGRRDTGLPLVGSFTSFPYRHHG